MAAITRGGGAGTSRGGPSATISARAFAHPELVARIANPTTQIPSPNRRRGGRAAANHPRGARQLLPCGTWDPGFGFWVSLITPPLLCARQEHPEHRPTARRRLH